MKIYVLLTTFCVGKNVSLPVVDAFPTYEDANEHLNKVIAEYLEADAGYMITHDEGFPHLAFSLVPQNRIVVLQRADSPLSATMFNLTDTEIAL